MNRDQHADGREYELAAAKRKTSNISPHILREAEKHILREAEKPSRIVVEDGTMRTDDPTSTAVASSVDRVANRACTLANILQDKLGPIMGPHDEEAIEEAELEMESLRLRREAYPLLFASLQESIDCIEGALTRIELCLRRTELP